VELSLTDALCTRCGLCCDGSFLADVELAGEDEAEGLEAMGLAIEEDDAGGWLLVQPCRALEGRRCTVYPHRPECCRTFECRLLQEARRGLVSVEEACRRIDEAQARIGRLEGRVRELGQRDQGLVLADRCAEALELAEAGGPATRRKRGALRAEQLEVEAFLRATFLRAGE
jgi:Fe-S-cluster containining protein